MKSQRKIGIVGHGYVGKAMHEFFRKHFDVLLHDPQLVPGRDENAATREQINTCDLAVVSVPTPSRPDGGCDVTAVEDTVRWLETPQILIKSTVSVGTTDRLRKETGKHIVFSPEYCGESSYWTPYAFHTRIVETPFFTFGGAPEDTSAMVDFFLPVAGPTKTYRQTTAKAAELAKYMENTFYATKITFCYEFAVLCEKMGIDFNEVRELWLLDPRINPMHTAVFGENDLPFAGKCLPKDLKAMVSIGEEHQHRMELLAEVLRSNERLGKIRRQRREERAAKTGRPQNKLKKAS